MASDNHTIGPQKNCRLTIADCRLEERLIDDCGWPIERAAQLLYSSLSIGNQQSAIVNSSAWWIIQRPPRAESRIRATARVLQKCVLRPHFVLRVRAYQKRSDRRVVPSGRKATLPWFRRQGTAGPSTTGRRRGRSWRLFRSPDPERRATEHDRDRCLADGPRG